MITVRLFCESLVSLTNPDIVLSQCQRKLRLNARDEGRISPSPRIIIRNDVDHRLFSPRQATRMRDRVFPSTANHEYTRAKSFETPPLPLRRRLPRLYYRENEMSGLSLPSRPSFFRRFRVDSLSRGTPDLPFFFFFFSRSSSRDTL